MEYDDFKLENVLDGAFIDGIARVISRRNMGKICFCDVRFRGKNIQVFFEKNLTNYKDLAALPLGSLFSFNGNKTMTRNGVPSIRVAAAEILFVFKGTMPDKYHGLVPSMRYRNRVVDLLTNQDAFLLVQKIPLVLMGIRNVLYKNGFQEFMTGILQETFEAGQAQPFETLCQANNKKMYLSLTSELKLKRLIVAGFERVFEITQSFRNEGIDSVHSPEFTILEAYAVNFSYIEMMGLVEEMIGQIFFYCSGTRGNTFCDVKFGNQVNISYVPPFERITFREIFQKIEGDWENCRQDHLSQKYPDMFNMEMTRFTWVMKVFERLIVPHIINPTFVTEIPSGLSPFVRESTMNTAVSERAFLVAQGVFLADIYTDENNLVKVVSAMEKQSNQNHNQLNKDYIEVMEFGIPNTAGVGMGINRLLMLLLGNLPNNIKETILYPML